MQLERLFWRMQILTTIAMQCWHARILYRDKKSNSTSYSYEMDLSANDVKTIAGQYQSGGMVFWAGRWIDALDILEFLVYQTEEHSTSYETQELTGSSAIFAQRKGMDVTRQFITSPPKSADREAKVLKKPNLGKHIFVVHGRDLGPPQELARILEGLDLKPVILSEQPSASSTLIEKLEKYSDVGFAFIILTPDDLGGLVDAEPNLRKRARQNVVLELGYFMGLLGRDKVYCLCKGDIEWPSDVMGIAYAQFNQSIKEVYWYILKELVAVGYKFEGVSYLENK